MATEPAPSAVPAVPAPGQVDAPDTVPALRPTPLHRALDALSRVSLAFAAVCIVAMAALVTVMVVSRFFFQEPLAELFEFSEYSILAITMLASPLLLRTDEHIKMDLLSEFLGPDHRFVRVTDWFVAIVVALVAVSVTAFGILQWAADLRSGTITQTYLGPVRWPLTALIVIGSAGMSVEALRRLLALIQRPAAG